VIRSVTSKYLLVHNHAAVCIDVDRFNYYARLVRLFFASANTAMALRYGVLPHPVPKNSIKSINDSLIMRRKK
jgi:hypothetical protein